MAEIGITSIIVAVYIMFRFNRSIGKLENGLESAITFGSNQVNYQLDNQKKVLGRKYGKLEKSIIQSPEKYSSRGNFNRSMKSLRSQERATTE